ncbi:hypothetical protein [Actinobacillus delphinicola]|uniref:Uncharacterized protein n=1 Tax=Actinobacillus delphinicola TaxID=51161 RepID=A0A448TVT1_9PAST|nr:hypothetical protein [Actinobacillus delphinicola]VEJ10045.1 Uncharacterised protein [Actinobacillus delphinicola]
MKKIKCIKNLIQPFSYIKNIFLFKENKKDNDFIKELKDFINTPFLNSLLSIDKNINKIILVLSPLWGTTIAYLVINQYFIDNKINITLNDIGFGNGFTIISIAIGFTSILYLLPLLLTYIYFKYTIKSFLKISNNITLFPFVFTIYTFIFYCIIIYSLPFLFPPEWINILRSIILIFYTISIIFSFILHIKADMGDYFLIFTSIILVIYFYILSNINKYLYCSYNIILIIIVLVFATYSLIIAKPYFIYIFSYFFKHKKITFCFKKIISILKFKEIITILVIILTFFFIKTISLNDILSFILEDFNFVENKNNTKVYVISNKVNKLQFPPNFGKKYKGYFKWKIGDKFIFCKYDKNETQNINKLSQINNQKDQKCKKLSPTEISLWSN